MKSLKNHKALSALVVVIIIVVIVAAAVLAVVLIIWFSPGNQKTQTFSFTDFNALNVGSAFKVTILHSRAPTA